MQPKPKKMRITVNGSLEKGVEIWTKPPKGFEHPNPKMKAKLLKAILAVLSQKNVGMGYFSQKESPMDT